jgi:hypothetical protein
VDSTGLERTQGLELSKARQHHRRIGERNFDMMVNGLFVPRDRLSAQPLLTLLPKRRRSMTRKPYFLLACTLLTAILLSACTGIQAAPPAQSLSLQFISHLAMGMPEQDAFVEQEPGSDQVIRIVAGEEAQYADAPVYAAAALVEHDPFAVGTDPLGPFAKGAPLGMTMGEWLSASGTGSYVQRGNAATIDLTMENLVPNGVYTVWCSRVSYPPNVAIVDKACGAEDGSENSFSADEQGRAQFNLTMPALAASTAETGSVIAIAYHSDGQTYGAYPGDFGRNSHVQIVGMVPAAE